MKNSALFILFVGLIVLTISCSKEQDLTPSDSISDYTNLIVGNYWVYDWYEVDLLEIETYLKTDSIYIEKDTIIFEKNYVIESGTFLGNPMKRILFDSAQSLYSYPNLELIFTLDKDIKYVRNIGGSDLTLAIGTYQLSDRSEMVSVPMGTFDCLNFEGIIQSLDDKYEYGTRDIDNYFAKNIGLVKASCFLYNSPNILEMRLVRHGKM
ncbi:MAG: hypothetical protein OEX22_03115 [Cyclobacteriaceae bacterium]|nr:hypothetical protein [Cyclobacteriaceae bacterium]